MIALLATRVPEMVFSKCNTIHNRESLLPHHDKSVYNRLVVCLCVFTTSPSATDSARESQVDSYDIPLSGQIRLIATGISLEYHNLHQSKHPG